MINNKEIKPTVTASGSAEYNGEKINLIGETFEDFLVKNDGGEFYSAIKFEDSDKKPWGMKILLFKEKLEMADYKKHFDYIKQNIENYS